MVRFQLKGGIWTNAEDEILKAGIMKYGLNSWGSIASLLHRKTAQQCKTRWEEYLKPTIRKTDWTHDEEEKLLQLAKMFPNQWRTIAPMLNRTAQQCIERFTYLSDLALGKAPEASEYGNKYDGNVLPEHKPARPDAVDQDETEFEMIQTAQARMANTMGKKGKRRARERHLQDAREMAKLQRIREMRAAGVVQKSTNKDDHDLLNMSKFRVPTTNTDVFDTSQERAQEKQDQKLSSFVGKRVKDIEGESKDEKLEKMKQQAYLKDKELKETNLPAYIVKTSKIDLEALQQPRAKLVLSDVTSTPQPSTTIAPASSSSSSALPSISSGALLSSISSLPLTVATIKQDEQEPQPLAPTIGNDVQRVNILAAVSELDKLTKPVPPPKIYIDDKAQLHTADSSREQTQGSMEDDTSALPFLPAHFIEPPPASISLPADYVPGSSQPALTGRQKALRAQGWLRQKTIQAERTLKQARITMGGYEKRVNSIDKDLNTQYKSYQDQIRSLESYTSLMYNEQRAITFRMNHWKQAVSDVNAIQLKYQQEYADLQYVTLVPPSSSSSTTGTSSAVSVQNNQ